MRPLAIDIEGFGSWKSAQHISFSDTRAIAVVGENGAGKCLPGSALVFDTLAGGYISIQDFVRNRRPETIGLVGTQVMPVAVSGWHEVGVKPLLRITVGSGRSLVCATTHPLWGPSGCVLARDIVEGALVGLLDESKQRIRLEFVISVEETGEEACFDITVDTDEHLYIADDFVVHNSSLLDSVLFALFGWIRSPTLSEQISLGADTMSVGFTWEQDHTVWRVDRARTSTGAQLALQKQVEDDSGIGWEMVSSGAKVTQPVIDRLVGCSAEDMIASCWIRQGDSGKFCDARPAERRQILERILDLPYARLAKEASAVLKGLEQELAVMATIRESAQALVDAEPDLLSRSAEYQNELVEIDSAIAELNTRLAGAESDRERLAEVHRAEQRIKALERAVQILETNRRLVSEVQETLADCAVRRAEHTEIAERSGPVVERLGGRITTARAEMAAVEQQIEEAQSRIAQLEMSEEDRVCWTCHQPVSDVVLQALLDAGEAQVSEGQKTIAKYMKDIARWEKELRGAVAERDAAVGALARLDKEEAGLQAKLAGAGKAIEESNDAPVLLEEAREILAGLMGVDEGAGQFDKWRVALAGLSRRRDEILREEGGIKAELGRVGAAREKLAASNAAWVAGEERQQSLRLLIKACGGDQIPSRIIKSKLEGLENEVNLWLGMITHGEMLVRFATSKEGATASSKDTLLIMVETASGVLNYDNFSGGEKMRLDLAIRIGISRLLANRSGTPIKFLVIDEGWGVLDRDGIQSLIDALMSLTVAFELIITVTHTAGVAEAFPARLEVSKTSKGSAACLVMREA